MTLEVEFCMLGCINAWKIDNVGQNLHVAKWIKLYSYVGQNIILYAHVFMSCMQNIYAGYL